MKLFKKKSYTIFIDEKLQKKQSSKIRSIGDRSFGVPVAELTLIYLQQESTFLANASFQYFFQLYVLTYEYFLHLLRRFDKKQNLKQTIINSIPDEMCKE